MGPRPGPHAGPSATSPKNPPPPPPPLSSPVRLLSAGPGRPSRRAVLPGECWRGANDSETTRGGLAGGTRTPPRLAACRAPRRAPSESRAASESAARR